VESAVEAELRARSLLGSEQRAQEATSRQERDLLERQGVTAAEGQRQLEWQRSAERRRRDLANAARGAAQARDEALAAQERARQAVERAQAEVEQVEARLGRAAQTRRLQQEQALQESVDEGSLRRFFGRRET
jgi:hypothetical protein